MYDAKGTDIYGDILSSHRNTQPWPQTEFFTLVWHLAYVSPHKNRKMMEYTRHAHHQQFHLRHSLFCTKLEFSIIILFNITTHVELDELYYLYYVSLLE